VGIGTTSPGEKLTIAGNILFNSSSGGTRQIIVGDELASDINGTSLTISAGKGGPISSNPRVGGTLTLRGGDGNSTTGGDGGNVYVYGGSKGAFGTSNGNVILAHTGSGARGAVGIGTTSMGSAKLKVQGKITAEEFDPQYNIDGQTYATWALSTTGLREETVGKVKLSRIQNSKQEDIFQYEIDFDQVEKGSDLWLFKEITDFGKKGENLVVMLTAEGRAQVWYEFRAKENKLIIYGDGPVSVSYRLIALRFDHANHANLAPKEDQGGGIKIR
jgi:hypothetical protein